MKTHRFVVRGRTACATLFPYPTLRLLLTFLLYAGLTLTGCGGGGGSSGGGGSGGGSGTTLSGIAAKGAPLVSATVTLKDRDGVQRSATTDASGAFSLDVGGLTPPFTVRVEAGALTLFSQAPGAGTVAVHPFSNLPLAIYYEGQNLDLATVFDGLGASSPLPSEQELATLTGIIKQLIAQFLSAAGLDPDTFNLLTTLFDADGTGFDGVLDDTVFASNGQDFTTDNGTVEQVVDVSVDGSDGTVIFNSTATDSDGNTSQSQQTTQITPAASQSDLTAALEAVTETLTDLLAAMQAEGATAEDALPFIDADYLDDGTDQAGVANEMLAFFAEELPPNTVSAANIDRILEFIEDGDTDRISLAILLQITPPTGEPFFEELGDAQEPAVFRRQADGGFLFYGRQTRIQANVESEFVRSYDDGGGPGTFTDRKRMSAQGNVAPDSIDTIVVSNTNMLLPECSGGAEAGSDSDTERPLNQSSLTLDKRSGLFEDDGVPQERFDLPCASGFPALQEYPPAGALYTFAVTPVSGSAFEQTSVLNGNTTEPINIFTVNGEEVNAFRASNGGADVRGTTLTLTWEAPDTFPVRGVELRGFAQNADQQVSGGGNDFEGPLLRPDATSGSIEIPTQVDGADVTNVGVNVVYEGPNGEISQSTLLFQ